MPDDAEMPTNVFNEPRQPSSPTSFFHENSHPTVIKYTLKDPSAPPSPAPPVATVRSRKAVAPEPMPEAEIDGQPTLTSTNT